LFSSHLEHLNLSNNRIPSIETLVFFRKDGTSKFPKLNFLDLSHNMLRVVDLLWPMSLIQSQLKIKLNHNYISKFVNEMHLSFSNNFLKPIDAERSVDLTYNLINSLNDYSFLQYNVKSAFDLENFLKKLANYDFAGNVINCDCSESRYVLAWFEEKNLNNTINSFKGLGNTIYQSECANRPGFNAFAFNCLVI
jgi:hypothetical protein